MNKENAVLARQRHYRKVKELKTLEKRVMQRIWDEFSEKEDQEAKGMVHIDNTQKLVECLLLAVNSIKSYYNLLGNGSVKDICYNWLYNKKFWTGKYVSKQDIFDGEFQRKIIPETVFIRDYFQSDDGKDKDDPTYDGFFNMIHHLYKSMRPIQKYGIEVMFVNLLMRNELEKMRFEEQEQTRKDK